MSVGSYIENIAKDHARGIATEHTFRPALKALIEELIPDVAATNEPKRIDCGAPDYVITRKDIPVGYIEAKDIATDLDGKNLTEQFDRYRDALDNLVFTDYLDFRFYLNGQPTASIKIGEVRNGKLVALPENFDQFTNLIKEFCSRQSVTIKSAKTLAEMMAEKAKILAYIIKNALEKDIANGIESDLTNQLKAFKDILIHDIDAKAFADIYAQTIAYGMFAARLHDPTLATFSRREAAELIPKTNPFLRKLFQFIAAFDLDTRIDWIVDALADLFRATDIAAILKNFGKSTQTHDPIMHFYETFLAEYDPKLRKSRGVFYTPEPVVDFIVRAVDDILKTEFNLPNGLADTSKTKIKVDVQGKLQEREVHKVQILDPATGTGTFLATVIKHIYKGFENQQGVWNQYVDEHLIPRLNGFELLMASYAMAHLKLDLLLTELSSGPTLDAASPPYLRKSSAFPDADPNDPSGSAAGGEASKKVEDIPVKQSFTANRQAQPDNQRSQRFQIYLTNALEEYHPDTGTLFASWLSTEANEANHIKRDTPVMVVIGNPPYAVSSSNASFDNEGDLTWIGNLIDDYKRNLNERKINLDDDYIKFIRFGEHFIEKNGDGVLAYISNNSFIDGITHRQMRKHLLETFDSIYVLDLHGSAKKNETAPDGSSDQNVFDIMQGVSINVFVKKGQGKPDKLGDIYHSELWGDRDSKYDRLLSSSFRKILWEKLDVVPPNYFFVPKDLSGSDEYAEGFQLTNLFNNYNSGVQTKRDALTINFSRDSALTRIEDFRNLESEELRKKYALPDDGRDWRIDWAKDDVTKNNPKVVEIFYRPFDKRFTVHTGKSKGFVAYPREPYTNYFLDGKNINLVVCRQLSTFGFQHCLVSDVISDLNSVSLQTKEQSYQFPLYLYPDNNAQQTLDGRTERVPNLNSEIVEKIAAAIGHSFIAECGVRNAESRQEEKELAPIDILDYIYAVLHSPSYREKYKEFLKIDFPRVPYPKDAATFWQLVALGGELRQIHLLESPVVNKFITGFNVGGENIVEKITFVSVPPAVAGGLSQPIDNSTVNNDNVQPSATADGTDKTGSVYFNETQYFSNVPEIAWNFYIGGYQPAQYWLSKRKGRKLSFEDIQHYQKIIVALTETDRLMKKIDKIDFLAPSNPKGT